MERRHFLKLTLGAAAGAGLLAAGAAAAPIAPLSLAAPADQPAVIARDDLHPAVTDAAEVEHLKPQEVRWHWRHHHWHRRWHWHRHWRRHG